jgi:hypothetical protein
MSTQVTAPTIVRRVAARAGASMWRARGGILIGLVLVAGITGYLALGATGSSPLPVAVGQSAAPSSDCADTAMAAIADKSPNAAQRAYACMDASFQQRVPEQTFVQQTLPNVDNVSRVGDYHSQGGGSMVYYAVDTNGQSIGYIVYLGQDGKVMRIE